MLGYQQSFAVIIKHNLNIMVVEASFSFNLSWDASLDKREKCTCPSKAHQKNGMGSSASSRTSSDRKSLIQMHSGRAIKPCLISCPTPSSRTIRNTTKSVQIKIPSERDENCFHILPQYSRRTKALLYYNDEEYDDMADDARYAAADLEAGALEETDETTARGLERRTKQGMRERSSWRKACRNRVLEEQDRQWLVLDLSEPVDDEAIRRVSREETFAATMLARCRAAEDARFAREYLGISEEECDTCTQGTMETSSSSLSTSCYEYIGFSNVTVRPVEDDSTEAVERSSTTLSTEAYFIDEDLAKLADTPLSPPKRKQSAKIVKTKPIMPANPPRMFSKNNGSIRAPAMPQRQVSSNLQTPSDPVTPKSVPSPLLSKGGSDMSPVKPMRRSSDNEDKEPRRIPRKALYTKDNNDLSLLRSPPSFTSTGSRITVLSASKCSLEKATNMENDLNSPSSQTIPSRKISLMIPDIPDLSD